MSLNDFSLAALMIFVHSMQKTLSHSSQCPTIGSSIALIRGHAQFRMMLFLIIEAVVGILASASWTRAYHDSGDESSFVEIV
jgi:hypothetical protein